MNFSEFINHFIALLVIANPLSALTAVLRLTQRQNVAEKQQSAIVATIAIGFILILVTWAGTPLLNILGIELAAFQCTGGIILFVIAFSMLNAEESPLKQSPEEQKERPPKSAVAIVPLAIPIIAGPAAISTIIVSVNQNPGLANQVLLTLASLLVTLVIGLVLYFSSSLEKVIGQKGINIFNRIGGLILAAIAVQTLAKGALGLFPGWGIAS